MSISREKHKSKWRYRWQECYITPTGEKKRRSSKWFASKAECEADREKFLAKPMNEKKSNRGIPFRQIHLEWVEHTKKDNVKKTQDEKVRAVELYFGKLMDMDVFKITPLAIKREMNKPEFSKLGTNRKNKILDFLRGIFDYAMAFYDLPRNPMRVIPRFLKTQAEKSQSQEILTVEEFNQLMDAIDSKYEVVKRLFQFLYWTGARLNEGASLTFSDLHGSCVNIWRQWIPQEKQFRELKTDGSRRTISLDSDLLDLIQQQRALYESYPGFDENWFIFGGPRHLPYTSVERVKNRACDTAGLPRVKIHSFRHSHASNLIAAKAPILQISRRLGHSSTTMTLDVYSHLFRDEDEGVMEAIEKLKK